MKKKPRRLPTRRAMRPLTKLAEDGRVFGDAVWCRLLSHAAGLSRRVVVRLSPVSPKKKLQVSSGVLYPPPWPPRRPNDRE